MDVQAYLFLVYQPCPRGKFAYQPSALAGVRDATYDTVLYVFSTSDQCAGTVRDPHGRGRVPF